jgi:hypothetical protein
VVTIPFVNNLFSIEILLSSNKIVENYEMKNIYYTGIPIVTFIIGLGLFVSIRGDVSYFVSLGFLFLTVILFLILFVRELSLIFKSKKMEKKVEFIPEKNKRRIFLEIIAMFSILLFLVYYILALVEFYIFDVHNIFPSIKIAMVVFSLLSFSIKSIVYTLLFVNLMGKS